MKEGMTVDSTWKIHDNVNDDVAYLCDADGGQITHCRKLFDKAGVNMSPVYSPPMEATPDKRQRRLNSKTTVTTNAKLKEKHGVNMYIKPAPKDSKRRPGPRRA